MNNTTTPVTRVNKAPSMYADRSMPNTGGWQDRHDSAIRVNSTGSSRIHPMERPIVQTLLSWSDYAGLHNERYESPIGEDYFLGEHWKQWGLAIRGLLNGETGRLDCGTLDAFILDTLAANGIDTTEL